jgi:hypothetical protein
MAGVRKFDNIVLNTEGARIYDMNFGITFHLQTFQVNMLK